MKGRLGGKRTVWLAAGAVMLAATQLPVGALLRAQATTPSATLPEFEVATIKPSSPNDVHGATFSFTPGEGVNVTNGAVKGLVEMAYDVRDFQILGGPGWVNSDLFNIVAKSASDAAGTSTSNSSASIQETRLRLQALLAQRFQLKIRRETKELPVYVLEVGQKGAKLVENSATNSAGGPPAGINAGCGQMTGTNTSMANLAYKLSRQLDRTVLDRTGLTKNYDFQFSWTPDTGGCSAPALSAGSSAATGADGPSLFTALQEQLGLRLVSQKAPVDVLVIEHVERPTAN
jgi:bla regulator protein blaR1